MSRARDVADLLGTSSPIIDKNIVNAKGDLITASANDTPAILTAGSNGQTLVADSSQTNGLRYIDPPFTGRNLIINGQFLAWQRGASFTGISTDGTYTADRWFANRGGNMDVTRRSLGTYNPPAGFADYAECLNKTASNSFISFEQAIETSTTIPLRGKVVTVSFYARAAADTAKSKSLNARLISSTSTDTKTAGGVVGSTETVTIPFGTAATDWQRFTFSRTVPTDCSTLRVAFDQAPSGGLAVDDGFHIAGVQVEVSPVATPFEFEPYEATLRKCQRYYYLHAEGTGKAIGNAANYNSTSVYGVVHFPTTMRTTPSLTVATGTNFYRFNRNDTSDDFNSLAIGESSENVGRIGNISEISGTAGHAGWLVTNNAAANLAFSAEL